MHNKCWIDYSLDTVESDMKAKLYGWRYHTTHGMRQNYYTSFNVTITKPETCKIDLNYDYIKPKQQICGKLDVLNPQFIQVMIL